MTNDLPTQEHGSRAVTKLGATCTGAGVHFAVFSENAEAVELCLFDSATDQQEARRIRLGEPRDGIWSAYVDGAGPGQLYGYRAYGPYRPAEGLRFNPHKLLLDPYARAITGRSTESDRVLAYSPGASPDDASAMNTQDSAAVAPKGVVIDPAFDWGSDRRPGVPWEETVIYECHVKGMTARHPEVSPGERRRYLGLVSEPILRHLKSLGVTAVELLPVHQFWDQRALLRRGLVNYWGYNTIGYFAPEARYATGDDGRQVVEFKEMVKRLHEHGIEVILDVVFNHSGEGDEIGPTIVFRGLDNQTYYRLDGRHPNKYIEVTGCGNTLNLSHPRVFQLVMDSLRYWVEEMHVDGFRLDLAPALCRTAYGIDVQNGIIAAILADPVLSTVKWIAEPWDLGDDGYQLGRFPQRIAEWNDDYRDTVRRFWRGDKGQVGAMASRLSGSSDVFSAGRGPLASVNFVTCHDGLTLRDLVSYGRKRNLANGEQNRDGADANHSRNWGVEGPTDDDNVRRVRERLQHNFIATTALSLGVPMISAGDEIGRTQQGNNNAYCQDNEVSWLNWAEADAGRLMFVKEVLRVRRECACFRRRTFFSGQADPATGIKDVMWLREDGHEMAAHDWHSHKRHVLGMLVRNDVAQGGDREPGGDEQTPAAAALLLVLNASDIACHFHLPEMPPGGKWQGVLDTARPNVPWDEHVAEHLEMVPYSLVLLGYAASRQA